MDCKETCTSPSFHWHSLIFERGPSTISARKRLPIIASSAKKKSNTAHHANRVTSTPFERDPIPAESKFTHNVDADLRKMCQEGHVRDAVAYFELMHKGGLQFVPQNYAFLLQECAIMKAVGEGKKVHALLASSNTKIDVFLRNNLLSMYVKCGCLNEARVMFDAMRASRDVVSWTLMINAHAQHGHFKEAMKLFFTMLKRHVKPNKITFVCLLKACNGPEALDDGKRIHEHVVRRRLEQDIYVGGALVHMYIKCGSIKCARKVFYGIPKKDGALWSLMIAGYVQNGQDKEALKAFHHMRRRHAIEPSEATWVHALEACGNLANPEQGKLVHACIRESQIELGDCVASELVRMYIRCGSVADARDVFDQMLVRPASVWTSMIAEYVECGKHEEVSKLLCKMQQVGLEPREIQAESIPTCNTTHE